MHFLVVTLLYIQDGDSKIKKSLLKATKLLGCKDRAVKGWDHPYAACCQPVTLWSIMKIDSSSNLRSSGHLLTAGRASATQTPRESPPPIQTLSIPCPCFPQRFVQPCRVCIILYHCSSDLPPHLRIYQYFDTLRGHRTTRKLMHLYFSCHVKLPSSQRPLLLVRIFAAGLSTQHQLHVTGTCICTPADVCETMTCPMALPVLTRVRFQLKSHQACLSPGGRPSLATAEVA